MLKFTVYYAVVSLTVCLLAITSGAVKADVKAVDVSPVWAGHPVGFSLLTHGDLQFVAFYDDQRQLTLAQRTLSSTKWKFKRLPTFVGWDSHNYVTMALDRDNILHVSGNMHVVPLIYFRGSKPLDIDSVKSVKQMTGDREKHVTYPKFYSTPSGQLVFAYRDGRSGSGDNLMNVFDEKTSTWRRFLDTPLMAGNGQMNAYMIDPEKGADGYYHVTWVWRNTPDASSNHDLSYIRSKDWVHWETINGISVQLPVTIKTPGVIVDPIPEKGGIVNGTGVVGFDQSGKLIISYFKFDSKGNTQLYLARFENGEWKHYQASDWKFRCDFEGGGTLVKQLRVGAVSWSNGTLSIPIWHKIYGSGVWKIDPATMKLKEKIPAPDRDPALAPLGKVESTFPGMQVNWSPDIGKGPGKTSYRLRWESLSSNRDQSRNPPLPSPSILRVIESTSK